MNIGGNLYVNLNCVSLILFFQPFVSIDNQGKKRHMKSKHTIHKQIRGRCTNVFLYKQRNRNDACHVIFIDVASF